MKASTQKRGIIALLLGLSTAVHAQSPEPKFHAQDLDTKIQIGYGLAIADVDGDGKQDILLADKKQFVWYRNPGKRDAAWDKFVLAENLTTNDNVCIAARDIDGDGKCEIAVGAEWNPGDTVNSGAVFYLIAPSDRTQKWDAVKFPSVEPTTHRMKWVKRGDGRFDLVVVPLHGRGNQNGAGAAVVVLAYQRPTNPRETWKSEVVCNTMHATHNFDAFELPDDKGHEHLIIGGKEGISYVIQKDGKWNGRLQADHAQYAPQLAGAGEVRIGWMPKDGKATPFGVAVEPMHGNMLAIYQQDNANRESKSPPRTMLDDTLAEGHALACGDLMALGRDQVIVGWRSPNKESKVGIKMFVSDEKGEKWTGHLIDNNTMSCEDLVIADLDGDKKPEIIASGRATKNVRIYWNQH
jgi:hypothetical protein